MSTAAIRAGKAFYEILADDKTSKGLNSADARLKRFGASVLVVGASISAAASAGLGMFGVAVAKFVSFGSEINDFAERTGASTDWAQAWKAAAELVGGSLGDVEIAIKNMQRSGMFAGLTVEEAMAKAASVINSIQDPMEKRRAAIELFGKSGIRMIPILDKMNERFDAMQKNGLLLSPEQIKTADDLGDSWDTLKNTFGAAVRLIGSALAPDLLKLVGYMTQGAIAAAQFVANNQGLFKALAFGLVILGGLGAALTVVGGAIAAAGLALTGLGTVLAWLPVLLPAIGAAFAYVATVAATMYAVFTLFPGLLTFLGDAFQTFGAIAAEAFSGIFNAIVQGNWALAGKIAMQGLMLAFQTGWSWLKIGWAETMNWLYGRMVDIFGSRIIGFIARTMKGIVEIINAGLAVFGYEGIEAGGLDKMIAAANNGDDALKRLGDAKVQATRDQAAKDIAAEQAKLDALNAQAAAKQEMQVMKVAPAAYVRSDVAAALAETKSMGFANSSAAARFAQFSPQFDPSEKLDEQIDVLKEVRDAVKANAVEFAD